MEAKPLDVLSVVCGAMKAGVSARWLGEDAGSLPEAVARAALLVLSTARSWQMMHLLSELFHPSLMSLIPEWLLVRILCRLHAGASGSDRDSNTAESKPHSALLSRPHD